MAKKNQPAWVHLLSGLMIGLFVSFLLYLSQQQPVQNLSTSIVNSIRSDIEHTEPKQHTKRPPQQFDFYEMLPKLEVNIPKVIQIEPSDSGNSTLPVEAQAPKETTQKQQAQYYLQVGAFQQHAGAEKQRASLLLQNWPAVTQQTYKNGKKLYRVYVGPYTDQRLDQVEKQLKEIGLQPHRHKISG